MFYFGQLFNLNNLCGYCFAPIQPVELADEYFSDDEGEDEDAPTADMNQFGIKNPTTETTSAPVDC